MKYNILKIFIHFFIVSLLTITTQIGGIIYLLTIFLIKKSKARYRLKRILLFLLLYFLTTFLIVPKIAPIFGRVKIENNKNLKAHNLITEICNRNYVNLKLNSILKEVSINLNTNFPGIKLIYLDANFPFFDGFPLLPHLSHNDGKKIDLSFIYEDENNRIVNLKPSNSGYGIFVKPIKKEINQTNICIKNGYWQYDFTKHLTFGSCKLNLKISEKATQKLIQILLEKPSTSKIFIEPHLKTRLKLTNSKIRFHGCQAVRHDDHIHLQIL